MITFKNIPESLNSILSERKEMEQLSFKFMKKIIEEESKNKADFLKTVSTGDGMYVVQDVYSQVDKSYFASSPLGIINAKNKV